MDFEQIGPLQVLVVGFGPDADFSGAVLDELELLTNRGMIRVIDLRFITRDDDGDVAEIELTGLDDDEAQAFGEVIGTLMEVAGQDADEGEGLLGPATIQRLTADMRPGESIGILLFEHTWATELKAAIRQTGGEFLAQGFLTPEAAIMIGAEVAAIAEAEATIELADAIAGAAMIDAAIAVAEAEDIKAAAAVEAVRALIAAGIVVDSAAAVALEALVTADLIAETALDAAAEIVQTTADETERALEQLAVNAATD